MHACHGHVHSEATKIKHKGNKDKAYNYKKYYNYQEDQGQLGKQIFDHLM